MIDPAASGVTLEGALPGEFDSPGALSPSAPAKVLMFSLAGHRHCAGIGPIREVIPLMPVTPLPGSPPQVRGLINLRGTIVTVLDATMSEYGVPSSAQTAFTDGDVGDMDADAAIRVSTESLTDGDRSVREIAGSLGVSEFNVAKTVYGMISTGLVTAPARARAMLDG